jgi:hypothetical protein
MLRMSLARAFVMAVLDSRWIRVWETGNSYANLYSLFFSCVYCFRNDLLSLSKDSGRVSCRGKMNCGWIDLFIAIK